MKKYLKPILIGCFIALLVICIFQRINYQKLRARYEVAASNEKSLLNRLEQNEEEIIEYQASLDVLQHTNDSVIQNLLKQQQKLNIKNKELQTMISMASQFHIHDTLQLHDTIFRRDFSLDTCLSDSWYRTCLHMKYPGDISVGSTMKSQKDVYIAAKRETIEPPKKFFLFRWFQKKHTVTRITIHEENPYIENQENVYIRILKD